MQIISNPIYLVLLAAIGIIYTLLAFKYAATRKGFTLTVERGFIIIILFTLVSVTIPPFSYINPKALTSIDKTFWSVLTQIGIYGSVMLVVSSRIASFLKNSGYVFSRLLSNNPFILIFLVVVILSTFWSGIPEQTLRSGIVLWVATVFSVYVGYHYNWTELSNILRWSNTWVALLSIPISLLVPSIGINSAKGGWQGIIEHPNRLGFVMSLNAILWILNATNKPKERWISLGFAIVSLFVLLMSNSASSLCAFIIVLGLSLSLNFVRKLKPRLACVVIILFIVVAISTTLWVTENLEVIVTSLGRDLTFTGRTDIWEQIWEAIQKRPLLGYGYQGFWVGWIPGHEIDPNDPSAFISAKNGWRPPNAHNGLLDICLDIGFLGLLLFVLSFLRNVTMAVLYLTRSKQVESVLPILLLLFVLLPNMSESQLVICNHIWVYYIILTVRLSLDNTDKSFSRLNL